MQTNERERLQRDWRGRFDLLHNQLDLFPQRYTFLWFLHYNLLFTSTNFLNFPLFKSVMFLLAPGLSSYGCLFLIVICDDVWILRWSNLINVKISRWGLLLQRSSLWWLESLRRFVPEFAATEDPLLICMFFLFDRYYLD